MLGTPVAAIGAESPGIGLNSTQGSLCTSTGNKALPARPRDRRTFLPAISSRLLRSGTVATKLPVFYDTKISRTRNISYHVATKMI